MSFRRKPASCTPPFHAVELVDGSTGFAPTATRPFDHDIVGVGDVVKPLAAQTSGSISLCATKGVDDPGNRFKVLGVNAVPNSTQMVQIEAARDGSDALDVHHPVCEEGSVGLSAALSVSTMIDAAAPDPTSVGINGVHGQVVDQNPFRLRIGLTVASPVSNAHSGYDLSTRGTPPVPALQGAIDDCQF